MVVWMLYLQFVIFISMWELFKMDRDLNLQPEYTLALCSGFSSLV